MQNELKYVLILFFSIAMIDLRPVTPCFLRYDSPENHWGSYACLFVRRLLSIIRIRNKYSLLIYISIYFILDQCVAQLI